MSYNRETYLAKRAQGLAPDDDRHGTRTAYNAYACRCDPCRKANRDWTRRHRGSTLTTPDALDTSVRARALGRLAAMHPEDFWRFVAAEKLEQGIR